MSEIKLEYQSKINFKRLKGGETLPATGAASEIESGTCTESEPFALQVKGTSMMPEFENGNIVVIDPSAAPEHGSFVIADCGDDGWQLRQLSINDSQWCLAVFDNSEAEIKIAPNTGAILGVVIQQSGTRRSAIKYYR